ncbi:MAG TPA: phosphoglycerate kinase, partial [Nitratifractor sp.]|nr:phosphoglycerate kinase [Nitratifractor sp.]
MRTIKDLDIAGKRVFIRCDFNVPKDEFGNITDDRRIRKALPTIRYCIDNGCNVVLASHFERPTPGEFTPEHSLEAVANRLNTILKIKKNLYFDDSKEGAVITKRAMDIFETMEGGDVLLLENLRFDAGETENSDAFAKQLSHFGEI